MTHQNLVLTEKAIKNHCKRLKKEIKNYHQDSSLGEIQNLFAKTLGFNNFHELKNVLNNKETKINNINDFYDLISKIEHKCDQFWMWNDGSTKYKPHQVKYDESLFINEHTFIQQDFLNILKLTLSDSDMYYLKQQKDSEVYLTMIHSQINDIVKRSIIINFSKENNSIYCINFSINYYIKNESTTKYYHEVKHLI